MSALSRMAQPLRTVFDLVLPPRCPGCRAMVTADGRFCAGCWQQLRFITAPLCPRCGTPFEHDRGPATVCAPCMAAPPRYASARAALAYEGPARQALLAFKMGDELHMARMMAPHMARAAGPMLGQGALLVPVPLHYWRLWRRGFNQAALLAQALAARTGLELAIDGLERRKLTQRSAGLGREARARNVRGAFKVRDKARIRGRAIILIDDVLTTGATAEACARVLLRGGAASVDVLTWARVVRDMG
jgi:ComF family protein